MQNENTSSAQNSTISSEDNEDEYEALKEDAEFLNDKLGVNSMSSNVDNSLDIELEKLLEFKRRLQKLKKEIPDYINQHQQMKKVAKSVSKKIGELNGTKGSTK